MKKLPKTFQGAQVVRGLGMGGDKLATFAEKHALDQFDATKEMWIVVEDKALSNSLKVDSLSPVEIRGFATKESAVRFARALSAGNVDHRVLRVTEQVLVVGTQNDL